MAPLVRTGGSRHTGLAAPPHRNIHDTNRDSLANLLPWSKTVQKKMLQSEKVSKKI